VVEVVAFAAGAYDGQLFTVTVDGTPATYLAGPTDTGADVRLGLVTAINALVLTQTGFFGGTSPQNTRVALLVIEEGGGGAFPLSVAGPALQIFAFLSVASPVTAVDAGALLAPAGSLRYCSLPAGITGVTNAEDATPGRTRETDSQFRARHQITQRGLGGGSPDAIRAIILSPLVVGGGDATFCLVEYNPTDTTDTDTGTGDCARAIEGLLADSSARLRLGQAGQARVTTKFSHAGGIDVLAAKFGLSCASPSTRR
jgi:hypothetical protein